MDWEAITEHDVQQRHYGWTTWVGTDQLKYARRTTGAALQVRGDSWPEVDDEIVKQERILEQNRPSAWA